MGGWSNAPTNTICYQIKSLRPGRGYTFFASLAKGFPPIDPPNTTGYRQCYSQCYNYTVRPTDEDTHARGVKHGESWRSSESSTPDGLAFKMLESVRNTPRRKSAQQAMNPASYSTTCLKDMPIVQQWHNTGGVTNDFLIRSDAHTVRWNPYLVQLMKPIT